MKKFNISILIFLFIIAITIIIASCKKEPNKDKDGTCVIGGIGVTGQFMFWVSKDYNGGAYTIKIYDDQGNDKSYSTLDNNKLAFFEATAPDACNKASTNYSKHAIAQLQFGKKYSYTATSENRTFKGTIDVPCDDQYTCKAIQIDK
jgi:hypothetical protein